MKTKILLIALIALFATTKQSHATEVFQTSDAIWVIHVYNNDSGNQYIYGLYGDTIINELTYQKLYLLNDTTLTITNEDIYVAGIRQTTEKQVFIQPADKKDGSKFEEYLMYDFGKSIGEEIHFGKRPNMGWGDATGSTFENVIKENIIEKIASIDYIRESKYGTEYIILGEQWVEGIGSLSGLFFLPLRYLNGIGWPSGARLICMKKESSIKYLREYCETCFNEDIHLSINSDKIDSKIFVSYNSTQNSIEINLMDEYTLSEFSLLSIDGQHVLKTSISAPNTSVNVSHIPKGIYIYTLIGSNINQSGKLIIK